MSNATAYPIYDQLFNEKKIVGGYQMQKFNSNLITGLGQKEELIALSALPYANVNADRIDQNIEGIRYISIKNRSGFVHKFANLFYLYSEGAKIINNNKPNYIICDAIAKSPCCISKALGRKFHIPVIGIITDLPGMLSVESRQAQKGIGRMQDFDAYILLTEQMNDIVNPKHKPYMVMEGLCANKLPAMYTGTRNKTIIYAGSLWKHDAGIEYFVEGFIKANIPEYELHLYGTGELVPWIEEISKTHPNVQYKGCVTNEEIVKIQSEATLLINPRPSTEEFCNYSFPSKTIEYMASGTPVLMTKLLGVPSEYFNYVYVIKDETADGVCDVLPDILTQRCEQLSEFGLNARKYVLDNKNCSVQSMRIWKFINEELG